jgi:hypothetical protein
MLLLSLVLASSQCFAQLFPVPTLDKDSSEPTMTFLYEAKEAKGTLIFIVGGEGHVGVKPNWDASHGYFSRYHFNTMLQTLSDPKSSSGFFNVVIYDNPKPFPIQGGAGRTSWSAMRAGSEHLERIESVVQFYRDKLKKPVWLMGHSLGSISITKFSDYLRDNKKEDLVAGYVYSAAVDGTSFEYDKLKVPVLVIHHELDGCNSTPLRNAEKVYGKLKDAGNTKAEFFVVKGGSAEQKGACYSGYHMYFGAGSEVAKAMDEFLSKHVAAR